MSAHLSYASCKPFYFAGRPMLIATWLRDHATMAWLNDKLRAIMKPSNVISDANAWSSSDDETYKAVWLSVHNL